jgi:hypothetical protein
MEPDRILQLVHIIQFDPDESKRKAAVLEMGRADPRLSAEVIQSVTEALLKDPAASVRLAAVEVIGHYNAVFPLSGLALETAVQTDASPAVRKAAKQALWEYHLLGYKSSKSGDEFLPQSIEPPRAKPARQSIPVTAEPPVVSPASSLSTRPAGPLPTLGALPGPRIALAPDSIATFPLLNGTLPHPNLTTEPPRAQAPFKVFIPKIVEEPSTSHHWPEPTGVGQAPSFARDLPSLVSPPGRIPGLVPLPETTVEPPLANPKRR